ncbi:MAG: tandem-95 repeat protein [Pirellulaceae bacterium]|nr:tandem-95 repeat protein [Pirellulaceae bacterium]
MFESLEHRTLLAADVMLPLEPALAGPLAEQYAVNTVAALDAEDLPRTGETGEGEDAPDLVAFAKALTDAGVQFFGAGWCPFCTEQKELFQDGQRFLPFIEVTNPDRTLNAIGQANNISVFPTWIMPDGDRFTGVLSLQQLSTESGVPLPQSSTPSFAPVADVTVLGGAPLHVALDGYDPNGTSLTYTVTSSNPALVTPELRTGRSLELNTSFGRIVIGTFEDLAPNTTAALFDLVEDDVWDDTVFHRVINGFMIQGGDPTGTGFGDSSLPRFDDEFHVDAQHTSANIASIAKAGDDSASSQFFLTEGPQRHLDFNHTVWGLIVEGQANREAISNVATNSSDRPTIDVDLFDATVFEDNENAVLTLKAANGATGTATITVTATDSEGLTFTQSFQVTVTPDTANGTPFLNPIQNIVTAPNTPITVMLTAQDVEGDAISFNSFTAPNVTVSLPATAVTPVGQTATASMTITPAPGFVGTQQVTVFVHAPSTPVNPNSVSPSQIASFADVQTITITVTESAPTGLDLVAASDSGISSTDNVTNDNTPAITVSGVQSGAIVRLYDGDTQVAQGTASGSTITLTTSQLASGVRTLTATQDLSGSESARSAALQVTIDTEIPNFTTTPPTAADLGVAVSYDPANAEEGSASFIYDLLLAPDGATINSATGLVNWTPVASQLGTQNFQLRATDIAGNTREQLFSVEVDGEVFAKFTYEIVDGSGNPLTAINVGDEFTMNVFVEDARRVPSGVFAAYLDVMFEQGLVEVVGPLSFGSQYTVARSGNTSTAGLIDEVGAASGSLSPLGGEKFLLFSANLKANIAGTERIFGDPADEPISHDMLVFGLDDAISTSLVDYGSVELTIGLGFGANGDIVNFDEDSTNNALNVLANDEGTGTLTITQVGTPNQGGTVTINGTGNGLIYTPAPNFNGSETFTYTVTDSGASGTSTATVVVQVQPVNDNPTAVNDTASAAPGSMNVFVDVLSNDSFAPDVGETLRVTAVSTPTGGGTARVGAGGNHVLYDAPATFTGTDTFTYTISDGNGGTATATVTVTATAGNGNPVANDDTFTVAEDSTDNVLEVLANDSTPDEGETLRIQSIQGTVVGGTAQIVDGATRIRFTPTPNFTGAASFTYVLSDGNGGTDTALVTIQVTNSNDAPTAVNDTLFANLNQASQILDVLANDTDPDSGDTLIIQSVTQGSAGGTVAISSNGLRIEYTPATDFTGQETFTYTVNDGAGESSVGSVTVTVRDFVPSSLSGFVYLDVNNNGIRESQEMMVVGVTIQLTGTDQDGNAVNLTRQTGSDGSYSFTELAPGQYTIIQVQPAFLLDGIETPGSQGGSTTVNDQIAVTLAEDTQGVNNNFGERGRVPQAITLMDLLASSHNESLIVAVDTAGARSWYAADTDWTSLQLTDLTTSAESLPTLTPVTYNLTLVSSNGNGGASQSRVSTEDASRALIVANGSTHSLLRVLGSPSAFQFVPVTTGSSNDSGNSGNSGSGGEGEGALLAVDLRSSLAGEGESSSLLVGAYTAGDQQVPMPSSDSNVPPVLAAIADPTSIATQQPSGSDSQPGPGDDSLDSELDSELQALDAVFAEWEETI